MMGLCWLDCVRLAEAYSIVSPPHVYVEVYNSGIAIIGGYRYTEDMKARLEPRELNKIVVRKYGHGVS